MDITNFELIKIPYGNILNLGTFQKEEENISETIVITTLQGDFQVESHKHDVGDVEIMFLYGSGVIYIDKKTMPYKKGVSITIPAGVYHGFKTLEETSFFSTIKLPLGYVPDLTKDL